MPDEIEKDMDISKFNTRTWVIPINITMVYNKKVRSHYYFRYGKNLFCLSQIYNHIPGHGTLTRKDLNVQSVN